MKLFDEWYEVYIEYSDLPGYQSMCKDAFRAGMKAAADLVKPTYVTNDYEAGKDGAATIIIEELE